MVPARLRPLFVLALLVPLLSAQQADSAVRWRTDGEQAFDTIGWSLIGQTGDLDGDRVADLISASPGASTNLLSENGTVQAFSGASGALLWRRDGGTDQQRYGEVFTPTQTDVDGDGVQDFFVREPGLSVNGRVGNGSVEAVSGATGAILWRQVGVFDGEELGSDGAVLDDLDGDGVAEFAVGSRGASSNGLIRNGYLEVVSGRTGFPLWRLSGTGDNEGLGSQVRKVKDLDGDGFRDLVASNPKAGTNGLFRNGFVLAVSSATGQVLWRRDGAAANLQLGQVVRGFQDAGGDGVPDVLVVDSSASTQGWFGNGRVQLLSGADGATIWERSGNSHGENFGAELVLEQDFTGDGLRDLLIGVPNLSAWGMTENGAVRLLDGRTGAVLWERIGPDNYGRLGRILVLPGDVDGDGTPDVAAAAPDAHTLGRNGNGYLELLSGANGFPLWRRDGAADGDHLGQNLLDAQDLDGDGVQDLICGSPFADGGGLVNNGAVEAISGAGGGTIWRVTGGGDDARVGERLDRISDLDGDGRTDFLTASDLADTAGLTNNGCILALAGADGGLLWRYDGAVADERVAWSVLVLNDADLDGRDDLVIGAPYSDRGGLADNGSLIALSGGVTLPLAVTGLNQGATATLSLTGVEPGATVHFLASSRGADRIRIYTNNRYLKLALAKPLIQLGSVTADVAGNASVPVAVPAGTAGRTIWFQAVAEESTRTRRSRLISAEIGL